MNTQTALIRRERAEDSQLLKAIAKKSKELATLTGKFEVLSSQINEIQTEYEMRIGSLLRKINILDQEIERWRNIHVLIKQGISLDDALLVIDEEIKKHHEKQEKIWEFYDVAEEKDQVVLDSSSHIRKLWRKLAQKYHPDLSDNSSEKKEREKIMKLINNAYAKKDYDALKTIEEKEYTQEPLNFSSENLEERLVNIENALIRIRSAYALLRKSEWYTWRKKTRTERNTLFGEFEANLLKEIVRKEFRLSDLKNVVK